MGGVLLSEYSKEQSDFFIENNEVFFFRNEIDMVEKISFLLELNRLLRYFLCHSVTEYGRSQLLDIENPNGPLFRPLG
jgi:hypothetical protein